MQKIPLTTINQTESAVNTQLLETRYPDHGYSVRPVTKSTRSLGWSLEILSLVIATLALGAVITTLILHQNKPLPKWPSLITVNTLLAIFTAIMKTALLFPVAEGLGELKWLWFQKHRPLNDIEVLDLATRGPWGSLKLLFRARYPFCYKIGALVIVAALAIDPFTQQLLRYDYCYNEVAGQSATINRTNDYLTSGPHMYAGSAILDSTMSAAIYRGLLDPITTPTNGVPFICPSGNCTFDSSADFVHRSIGMCSYVQDITNSVQTMRNSSGNFSWLESSNIWTAPAQMLQIAPIYGTQVDEIYGPPLTAFEAIMKTFECNGTAPRAQQVKDAISGKLSCTLVPFAIRAWLRPCVQTFSKATVRNFQIEETLQSSMGLPSYIAGSGGYAFTIAGDYPAFPGVDCTPSDVPTQSKSQNTTEIIGSGGVRVVNNIYTPVYYRNETINPKYYDPACTYSFAGTTDRAISNYISDFWNGTVVTGYGSPSGAAGDPWLMRMYQYNSSDSNGFADIDSASRYMQGLADTMTSIMRQQIPVNNSAPLTGKVLISQTCIHVKWEWLGLPAGVLLLAAIFFAYSVLAYHKIKHEDRRPWKTSILPSLWTGLDERTKQDYQHINSVEEMEGVGKHLQVRLTAAVETRYHPEVESMVSHRHGWRLTEAGSAVPLER